MKKLIFAAGLLCLSLTAFIPGSVQADANTSKKCPSVLVTVKEGETRDPYTNTVISDCTKIRFRTYVGLLMNAVMPIVLFIGMIMIVYSGLQYMQAGLTPEAQKIAKARIISVLAGVMFYFLIDLILAQISPYVGG